MNINDFKLYLKQINENIEYSDGTKEFYKKHLPIIDSWFFENGIKTIDDITVELINGFISDSRKNCSEATINKRIGIIKRAIISLKLESKELKKILQFKKLKEVKRSYRMLSDKELKTIIRLMNSLSEENKNHLMYKTLIFLLIDTGARIGEILSIEKSNIDLNSCEILLKKTKTKIERYVYFYDVDTKGLIKKMLSIKNKSKFLLFNHNKNRPVNYDDVRYIMKLIKNNSNIRTIYPYMFRHTFATNLIENGADVFAVKELMGHEKLTTTQIYTHLSKKHIKNVYHKSHKR